MEYHFGTQRTESFTFLQCSVFRNSQIEDISSFSPANRINGLSLNDENLSYKVDVEVS